MINTGAARRTRCSPAALCGRTRACYSRANTFMSSSTKCLSWLHKATGTQPRAVRVALWGGSGSPPTGLGEPANNIRGTKMLTTLNLCRFRRLLCMRDRRHRKHTDACSGENGTAYGEHPFGFRSAWSGALESRSVTRHPRELQLGEMSRLHKGSERHASAMPDPARGSCSAVEQRRRRRLQIAYITRHLAAVGGMLSSYLCPIQPQRAISLSPALTPL